MVAAGSTPPLIRPRTLFRGRLRLRCPFLCTGQRRIPSSCCMPGSNRGIIRSRPPGRNMASRYNLRQVWKLDTNETVSQLAGWLGGTVNS